MLLKANAVIQNIGRDRHKTLRHELKTVDRATAVQGGPHPQGIMSRWP